VIKIRSIEGKDKHYHNRINEAVTNFSKKRFSIFLAAFCLIAFFALIQAAASSTSNSNAMLYLNPSSQKVGSGQTLTLEVWMDAKSQPVNAVQANLTYPVDKFDFAGIDTNGSAFEVEAQSSGGSGEVKIARGHVGALTGSQLVARVNLIAKSGKGNGNINFTGGSAIVRSTDNINVLSSTSGGHYNVATLAHSVFSRGAFSVSKKLLTPVLK
jgi:hypothetical protein